MSPLSELAVEDALCAHFAALGWTVAHASTLSRSQQREVFLVEALREALGRLNPTVPEEAREDALRELTRDRTSAVLVNANRDWYELLRDGVKTTHRDARGVDTHHTVRAVDWDTPAQNRFLLVRQLAVASVAGTRVPDLVGYVNGMPLLVGELKAPTVPLEAALSKNILPYLEDIPQLFVPNALVLLSNYVETRVGSLTGTEIEHFGRWTRSSEGAPRDPSVETAVRAVFEPQSFLDVVENFILYEQSKEGLRKLVGQNHQRLGVNAAVERIAAYGRLLDQGGTAEQLEAARRLGVFWHTQGSGKSYSMAMLVRKVHRKLPGDWAFVVVTDRVELDDQLYANFKATGAAENKKLQAESGAHLKKLLGANERVVFTLLHKFRLEEGQTRYPMVSKSPHVVVLVDEAHRSQKSGDETLSDNMRRALPHAGFMAFTGTPLVAGDETTRQRFGDYVSRYPFFAAIEDGATVPLYYEATLPDVQLGDKDLDEAMDRAAREAGLTDEQREEAEKRFSHFYVLLTRSSRLDKVAAHLVDHLLGFAPPMKAMAVCIDRPTTLRLAQRVEAQLALRKSTLEAQRDALEPHETRTRRALDASLAEVSALEWAVVVSRSQGDVDALAQQLRHHAAGVVAYARRMAEAQAQLGTGVADVFRGDTTLVAELQAEAQGEAASGEAQRKRDRAWVEKVLPKDVDALAKRFKEKTDPLRLVLVCSMWITGFDAPPCGIVYLDRPMANHTLMQTIARANRVFPGKDFGRVLDYVGVLKKLELAFAAYQRELTTGAPLEMPVEDLSKVLGALRRAIEEALALCARVGVDLAFLSASEGSQRLEATKDACERFAKDIDAREKVLLAANLVGRLFDSLGRHKSDEREVFRQDYEHLSTLARVLRTIDATARGKLQRVLTKLDEVLDEALSADVEHPAAVIAPVELGAIDLAALAEIAKGPHRHAQTQSVAEALRFLTAAAAAHNPKLLGLKARVEEAIEEYRTGAKGLEELLAKLMAAAKELEASNARAKRLGLPREDLGTLDVLLEALGARGTAPEAEAALVEAVRALKGLRESPVRDWRNTEAGRAQVRLALRDAVERAAGLVLTAEELLRVREAFFQRVYEVL